MVTAPNFSPPSLVKSRRTSQPPVCTPCWFWASAAVALDTSLPATPVGPSRYFAAPSRSHATIGSSALVGARARPVGRVGAVQSREGLGELRGDPGQRRVGGGVDRSARAPSRGPPGAPPVSGSGVAAGVGAGVAAGVGGRRGHQGEGHRPSLRGRGGHGRHARLIGRGSRSGRAPRAHSGPPEPRAHSGPHARVHRAARSGPPAPPGHLGPPAWARRPQAPAGSAAPRSAAPARRVGRRVRRGSTRRCCCPRW